MATTASTSSSSILSAISYWTITPSLRSRRRVYPSVDRLLRTVHVAGGTTVRRDVGQAVHETKILSLLPRCSRYWVRSGIAGWEMIQFRTNAEQWRELSGPTSTQQRSNHNLQGTLWCKTPLYPWLRRSTNSSRISFGGTGNW